MMKGESHFVLIHGAGHGAWCWYKVATLLKSAGHNVTTLDMAACGRNTKQVQEIGSISEYHEPLMTFMESLPSQNKVILVAHSFGGISISVAMESFPEKISVAIFVSAIIISENFTYPALIQERRKGWNPMDNQYLFFNGPNKPPTTVLFGPQYLETMMYQLSPPEDLTLALSLLRPCHLFSDDHDEVLKDTIVTSDKNGRVPKVFIVIQGDKLFKEEIQMWIIERTGSFAEVKVIKDADHMVMFSNPKELCSHLLEIADKY